MKKLAVILQYYGKLKPSFSLFYESARRNSDIDFYIFTDNKEPQNPANNVKWMYFTLSDFNKLAVKKLGVDFTILNPYKLCDFKPMYGAIFEDYIKDYEYWAYGDLDVIYGKIGEWLDKIDYKQYCKINHAGHFCVMRNTEKITTLFKSKALGAKYWKDVLESTNCAFDEIDMNIIMREKCLPFYDGVFAADIVNEKGMQVLDGKNIKRVFKIKQPMSAPKNYHYQVFLVENGRITRYYRKRFRVKKDDFCYIHYRLELPIYLENETANTYLFSFNPMGFFDVDTSKMTNLEVFKKTVRRYNNRLPLLFEKFFAVINITKKCLKIGAKK